MPAIVMECLKAEKHSNADTLRVYVFSCPQCPFVQVIANEQNIYSVGDKAIIVTAPSILQDGLFVTSINIRGIQSNGMALGKTNAAIGEDLSSEHCIDYTKSARFISWPEIESLFNVRKYLLDYPGHPTVLYRAKVKLDGCCSGVQLPPSDYDMPKVIYESRERIITPDNDVIGFSRWAENHKDYFLSLRDKADSLGITEHITIFGEFCGKKLQKGTAISQIDKKIFAVFAIQIGLFDPWLETDPEKISEFLQPEDGIYVIPWEGDSIVLDFSNTDRLKESAEIINIMVLRVESRDPWVHKTFNVDGIGEGVVLYPITNGTLVTKHEFSDLVFKAKGEKHKVVRTKQPAQIDPEVAKSATEFADLFVTENRLNQIAQRVGKPDLERTGDFLKEFNLDVQKESLAELEAAGLEWKQVAREVSDRARKWWVNLSKQL